MENTIQIAVADRNPNVRKFLKRELAALGIGVCLADNAGKLLGIIDGQMPIHLIVLDPDLPGIDSIDLCEKLVNRVPPLPVILYCVRGADNPSTLDKMKMVRIEKDGSSIDLLINTANNILMGNKIASDNGFILPQRTSGVTLDRR